MIPTKDMRGTYVDKNCSLNVKLLECLEEGDNYNLHLKVLKSLKEYCKYKEGDDFWFLQPKDADPNKLEKFVSWDDI